MSIDKNIPIYQISISNSNISQYYRKLSIKSFNKFGYYNIIHQEAITPETMDCVFGFTEKRQYKNGKERDWRNSEKAIWHSHYNTWKRIAESEQDSIVIEQDCILQKPISNHITEYDLFSFTTSERNHSLAAVGYYIKAKKAKNLIKDVNTRYIENKILIKAPVDGYIHSKEPHYPEGVLDLEYIKTNIFGTHFIDPKIGSDKGVLGLTGGIRK